MCTLTHIPLASNNFVWTQNRDESVGRATNELFIDSEIQILYPKDPLSGGSWIATSKQGRVVSLLNGAFVKHPYAPSTIKSRGIVVLDCISASNVQDFLENYVLDGVEPFTMIIRDNDSMWELRWDKTKKHIYPLNINFPYIWSSSTLYDAYHKFLRQSLFLQFLKQKSNLNQESILDFHLNAAVGDLQNNLKMKRAYVQTVSITSVSVQQDKMHMYYHDLVIDQIKHASI